MIGATPDVSRHGYAELVPPDEAEGSVEASRQPLDEEEQKRGCGYSRCGQLRVTPRVQIMAIVVAQPVTATLWSWGLHGCIPWIQVAFSSHVRVVNVLLFYLAFSVLVMALFPLGVIDLAAGFFFGVWVGFPVALTTKTSGSVLCFILSRYTCSDHLRRTMVEHYDWLAALGLMMRERQFRTMALLRFSVLPAALKNYGCGSLAVSLRMFAGVTALALSLESILLVPIGAQIDSLEKMMSRGHTPQEKVAVVLGVVLLLALVLTIRRTVRLQIEQIQRETSASSAGSDDSSPSDGGGDTLVRARAVLHPKRRSGAGVSQGSGGEWAGTCRDEALMIEHAVL